MKPTSKTRPITGITRLTNLEFEPEIKRAKRKRPYTSTEPNRIKTYNNETLKTAQTAEDPMLNRLHLFSNMKDRPITTGARTHTISDFRKIEAKTKEKDYDINQRFLTNYFTEPTSYFLHLPNSTIHNYKKNRGVDPDRNLYKYPKIEWETKKKVPFINHVGGGTIDFSKLHLEKEKMNNFIFDKIEETNTKNRPYTAFNSSNKIMQRNIESARPFGRSNRPMTSFNSINREIKKEVSKEMSHEKNNSDKFYENKNNDLPYYNSLKKFYTKIEKIRNEGYIVNPNIKNN